MNNKIEKIPVEEFLVYYCRVCGFSYHGHTALPWGPNGKSQSFDNCSCCGAEFGYHDYKPAAIQKHRSKWINEGKQFRYPKFQPENWDADEQMSHIPDEFIFPLDDLETTPEKPEENP